MNILALLAILLTIIGWILMGMTGINLLSGSFEGRSCQTDCVQMLFFSAVALGVIGLILSAISLRKPKGRIFSIIALLLSLGLCGVFGMLFVAGNFF